MRFGHNVRMEPKDRLKLAIEESGYENPSDAFRENERALKAGKVGKDLLISNSNGNRDISKNAASTYARIFGHTAGWYLYGVEDAPFASDGSAAGVTQVPVLSMVSAGRLKRQDGVTPSQVERWMPVANLPVGDWICLIVDGDSMDRVAPDQAAILVNRAESTLIDGKFYVFHLDNGETTFKTFRRDPMRLQPYSMNPDHMSLPVNSDTDFYVVGRVKRVIQDV